MSAGNLVRFQIVFWLRDKNDFIKMVTKPCFLTIPETVSLSLNCSDKSIFRPGGCFQKLPEYMRHPRGLSQAFSAFTGNLRSFPGQTLLRSFPEGGGGPGGASGGGSKGSRGSNLNCLNQFPFSGLIPFCCGELRSRAAGESEAEHRKLSQKAKDGKRSTES